ncbi:MAG: hypothetical protein BWY74_00109 [Firmicutes bacterium ADurb.Bin419]|nr:MAG: hypothetical protein BWY74_00109 [Firmicutes bacterium ADurb.Bin419]
MHEYYHAEERQPPRPPRPPFQQPGQGFGPPFGPPSGTPGGAPGASSGPPSGPPPAFTPQQSQSQGVGVFAVDPGAIRPCTFRYVFIWLNTGERFWAWLVFVGPRSAAGWRWTGFRWIYFGVDLRNIESFVCF